MKTLITISLLLISFLSHAAIPNSYLCWVENSSDVKSIRELKLPDYGHELLAVRFGKCKLTAGNANYDVCQVGQNSLVVGVDARKSVLITKTGKAYEFECSEETYAQPTPDSDGDEDEQEEQEQQQQEQQEGEPGHGGSNIRMRGIRTAPRT